MNCQQYELYAAEQNVPRGHDIEACELQSYVDELRETPYWASRYGNVLRIDAVALTWSQTVRGSVGAWFPKNNSGKIEMCPAHMCELFVLHEVAHVLADARHGSHSHDPYFTRVYLELVYTYMGSEAYAALKTAFEEAGIDDDPGTEERVGVRIMPGITEIEIDAAVTNDQLERLMYGKEES